MSDTLTLEEFPPVSTAEWDAAILKDLKGAAPKTRLYYRAEDLHGLEYLTPRPASFLIPAVPVRATNGAYGL